MTAADGWARDVADDCAQKNPEVFGLAVAVCLASRVEPVLLRRARLELCPGTHAGAESELWHSPLVQHRSPKAIVFAPAVAWLLQDLLRQAGRRPDLAAAWELLRDVHSGLPETLRLEEEITWRAVRDPADPEIGALLRRAVRTLIDGESPALAEWAARALPRLPAAARSSPEAFLLNLAASSRLGGMAVLGEPMPEALPADELFWIAARSAAQVQVYLRRQENELRLSLHAGEGDVPAPSVPAPSTHPVLIEVTSGDGTPRLLALRPEGPELAPLPLGADGVRLRTAAGDVFHVAAPLAPGRAAPARDLLALSPFRSAGALAPGSPVFVGRDGELRAILDGLERDSFLICGPRRMGKTSLLNRVFHAIRSRQGMRPVLIDCQGLRKARELQAIGDLRQDPDRKWSDERVREIFRELAWEAGRNSRRQVFLMDEIDGLVANDVEILQELRSLTGQLGARFVFTGFAAARQAAEAPDGPLHWVRGFPGQRAFSLGPLAPDDARSLLTRIELPEMEVTWPDPRARETAHVRILERTHAVPWLLQAACVELLGRLAGRGTTTATLEDVDSVLGRLPELWPVLEEEIHNLAGGTDGEPAGLAALVALQALVLEELVTDSDEPKFNFTAAMAVAAVRDAASRHPDQRVERRLAGYFASPSSIVPLFAKLTSNTLALGRHADIGRYGFTQDIYPSELVRLTGGVEGVRNRLFEAMSDLAAAILPRPSFTLEPVEPADPESARVSWEEGNAWRLEGRHPLVTERELLGGQPLVIAGEARSGLRSFLNWVRWMADARDKSFTLVTLDGRAVDLADERSLDRALAESLIEQLPDRTALRHFTDREGPPGLREAMAWYGKINSRRLPLVLAVVGLDGLAPAELAPVISGLRILTQESERWATLILSASWDRTLSPDINSSPFNVGPICRLPFFTAAEIAGLWDRFGPAKGAPQDTVSTCDEWTGGQPLLVQLFLREAARAASDPEQIASRMVMRPPEAVRLWQRDLAAILRTDPSVPRFLEALIAGRRTVPCRSAQQLFRLGWIRHDPQGDWRIRSKAHAEWARPILPGSAPPPSSAA